MLLEKTKIYGVDGVGGSTTTLTRTDGAVGLGYIKGASEIASDFDRCYPWCEMQEVVDESGNIFIRIPKFYTKITPNPDGTFKHQISGCRYDGFGTLFIDGKGNEIDYILVGKYEGSYNSETSKMCSKSGETVKVNINITKYRNYCKANGEGYQQYDFLIDAIIKELFLIEFATTHCQSIMAGFTNGDNAAALITGHTDCVATPSGSWNTGHTATDTEDCTTCNTDGHHACKYRGIENPFGNTWTFCDGINFDKEKIYVCTDPEYYEADKYTAPYTYMGNRVMTDGYTKKITPFAKNPLLGYVTEIGANGNTYYSDHYFQAATGTALLCGGLWAGGSYDGLWFWAGHTPSSNVDGVIGGRLCYKPL